MSDPAPVRTNKLAIWALVLGILGLLAWGILGIPAIVLAWKARAQIDSSKGFEGGRALATTGLVLGVIATVYLVVTITLALTGHSLAGL